MQCRASQIVFGILVCSLPFTVVGLVSAFSRSEPLPVLLQGLRANAWLQLGAPNDDFSRHLNALYPPGSSEAVLVRELWAEGFKPATGLNSPEQKAIFWKNGVSFDFTSRDATVTWMVDEHGRLRSISGKYVLRMS